MSLGFEFINILWGLPIITALLLIPYLIKGRQEKRVVSSLFLLKKILSSPTSKKIFNLQKRYFFDLLILALILLGIAGIFLKDRATSIILIDNSLSMFREGESGKSLFELAVEKAKLKLAKDGSFAKSEIYLTSPRLTKLNVVDDLDLFIKDGESESLQERTAKFTVYAPDFIERLIETFKSDASKNEIYVYTDKSAKEKTAVYGQNSIFINTISPHKNIGNLNFKSVLVDSINQKISLQVDNSNQNAGEIEISCDEAVDISSTIEFQNFFRKDFSILQNSVLTVDINTIPATLKGGECVLRGIKNSLEDSLPSDNQVFFTFESATKNILLISNYDQKLLSLDKLGKNIVVKSEYEATNEEINKYPGIIYHQVIPKEFPNKPFVVINPPSSDLVKTTAISSDNLSISNWSNLNPILQYLELGSLAIKKAVLLTVPNWGYSILGIEQGNILFAGMINGVKGSVVGFELFPYQGKDNLSTSILTLNLLSWAFEGALSGQFITPYREAMPWLNSTSSGKEAVKLGFTDGSSYEKLTKNSTVKQPGLISIKQSQTEQKFVAVNFFDDQESDPEIKVINLDDALLHQQVNVQLKQSTGGYPLFKELAIGLIILLLVDFLFLIRKRRHV